MPTQFVVRLYDVRYALSAAATITCAFDGGASIPMAPGASPGEYTITIPDGTGVLWVAATAQDADAWPIGQGFTFAAGPPPALSWQTPRTISARSLEQHAIGGKSAVYAGLVFCHFRDAKPAVDTSMSSHPGAVSYLTPQGHPIRDFASATMIDPGASGWSQFRATKVSATPDGKIFFGERRSVPRLAAFYVPLATVKTVRNDQVNPSLVPVPFHLFFAPSTFGYPNDVFATKYIDFLARYLVYPPIYNIGKALVNQHHAGGKGCVFVLPVPSNTKWYGSIAKATNLMRFFQEAAYFLQRMAGVGYPLQPVGHCALSAFSSAAKYLEELLDDPGLSGSDFDTKCLREIYGLDIRNNATGTAPPVVRQKVDRWLRGGADGRILRFYTQAYGWWSAFQSAVGGSPTTPSTKNAVEVQSASGTVLYVPYDSFWSALKAAAGSHPGTVDDPPPPATRTFDATHQLFPALFVEHAIKHAKFC